MCKIVIWKRSNYRVVLDTTNGFYHAEQKIWFFWTKWFYIPDLYFKGHMSMDINSVKNFLNKIITIKGYK